MLPGADASPPKVSVFLVSDVRLFRDGLVWGLAANTKLTVVGTAESAPLALSRLAEATSDVLLVDTCMAEALELIRAANVCHPHMKIVAFAVGGADHAVLNCIEAGSNGYVSREGTIEDLVSTVESVVRGETRCSPQVAASLFRRIAVLAGGHESRPSVALTQRERQIVELLDQGLSNKEIASELGIELATAKNHVHNILEKLQVRRRSQVGPRLGRHWQSPLSSPATRSKDKTA
jgi:two-component system nitrate/nitrite response regulator NarL